MRQFFSRYAFLPVPLVLLTLGSDSQGFFSQRAGLFFFLGLLGAWFFAKRYGWLVGIFAGYCLESAFFAVLWRNNRFEPLGNLGQAALHRAIFLGTVSALLSWVVIDTLPAKTFKRLFLMFGLACCFMSWFPVGFWAYENTLMTPTLMSTFLILLLPIAFEMKEFSLLGVYLVTILFQGGYTSALALWVMVLAYLSFSIGRWVVGLGLTGLSMGALYALFGHWQGDRWLAKGNERFGVWKLIWNWFWENPFHWFGMGAGTGYQLIPWIQKSADPSSEQRGLFVYLHSEPLQCLFELGIVGLSLALLIYFRSLVQMYRAKRMHEFAFLAALGVSSLTMPILRHDTTAFLAIFQLHLILKKGAERV